MPPGMAILMIWTGSFIVSFVVVVCVTCGVWCAQGYHCGFVSVRRRWWFGRMCLGMVLLVCGQVGVSLCGCVRGCMGASVGEWVVSVKRSVGLATPRVSFASIGLIGPIRFGVLGGVE